MDDVNIDGSVAGFGLPVDDVDDWFSWRTEHVLSRKTHGMASSNEHEVR
jgi:hypothetical protein